MEHAAAVQIAHSSKHTAKRSDPGVPRGAGQRGRDRLAVDPLRCEPHHVLIVERAPHAVEALDERHELRVRKALGQRRLSAQRVRIVARNRRVLQHANACREPVSGGHEAASSSLRRRAQRRVAVREMTHPPLC